ncbi:phosphoribosylglycinamide formyltransferase [Bacillus sp. S/N-304-OC-R1]|uniref:phosphoribosylglycinamide formyltransferase n=1 Tax=Bacillus sp. S/N-304-OC-R1 TaxID=2758034 RepID=UPI001C8DB6A9|nr:phosphoribosylglycinamide formyltransferase [Bacillus sp. S/N-304-OC-R1]MBY0122239.1 phosphoribosylglycinamide formyltransferase [Bacillus sp. S/N-304-OC-R1]
MKNIAVFASGSGTNFQAIADAAKKGNLHANIKLVVCDKPDAFCVERAERENIPCFTFSPKEFAGKEEYEKEILQKLREHHVEFIVLAGYMRLIGSVLLKEYEGRIVNIHPSLLPAFPGKDAIGQAIEAKVKETGVTVHFVDEGMDTGPVIEQKKVNIFVGETKESLQEKIHKVEHELYPAVLHKLFSNF